MRSSDFSSGNHALANVNRTALYPHWQNIPEDRKNNLHVFPSHEIDELPGFSAAQTAVRLAPDLPESHIALYIAAQWYYKGIASIKHLDRAIELDPNNAYLYYYRGTALGTAAGRTSDAVESFRRSVEIDPLMMPAHQYVGALSCGVRQI